jgi:inner membrane transporter RhtA
MADLQLHPRTGSLEPSAAPSASARAEGQAAPIALVLGGCFAQQFGAALATLLFPRVGAQGVVMLRLGFAAIVLILICRPKVRGFGRSDWSVIAGFGLALAAMNMLFYQAIARIPLGAAVTLEVLGPLTLSVIASRRAISWLWAGLALSGVVLLGLADLRDLNATGVAFALGAGAMWAGYILLSTSAGNRFPQADGLALAMTVGALIAAPFGVLEAGAAIVRPSTLALGAAVAVLSSAVPYTLELFSLRRLKTATFSVLMALVPAIAATAGLAVLGQHLTITGALAIMMVVAASIGAVRVSTQI